MTREELIEKIAVIIFHNEFKECDSYETAEEILNHIFDALKHPTDAMIDSYFKVKVKPYTMSDMCLIDWQAMLNASPLAKEGE